MKEIISCQTQICKQLNAGYKTFLVQFIISQFDLLKADNLFGELVRCEGRVRVSVQSPGRRGVALASHEPGGPMVGVPDMGTSRHLVEEMQ